jgi:2-haloacid dehalogenase
VDAAEATAKFSRVSVQITPKIILLKAMETRNMDRYLASTPTTGAVSSEAIEEYICLVHARDMSDRMISVPEIEACVFDAYGTLFDVHSPVSRVGARLGPSAAEMSKLWRQKQLEYTWLRSLMREHADFWQVTCDALDYAMKVYGIADTSLREELLALYWRLEAYPDALLCLKNLAKQKLKLAILSNGTPTMLAEAAATADITKYLDKIISVEEVGIYKPDPRVYGLALERLQIGSRSAIMFVSANPWDAQAAANFGFQVVRINRFALPNDNLPGQPALILNSLAELPVL